MKQYKLASITLIFLSLVFIANGAFASEPRKQQTQGAYRAQLEALMNANKVACKSASDCEAVAIGAKPCGGPTEYLLVSKGTRSKTGSDFDDNVKMITQLDVEANATGGMMGTCQAVKKPEVACASGACVESKEPPKK